MRRYTINSGLTPGRRAWLTKLRDQGPTERERGPVGYQCMHLGWTEWNFIAEGNPISPDEARQRFGDRWFDHVDCRGERITEAGLAALSEANHEEGQGNG